MAYNYWEERFKRLKAAEMRKAEQANADLARVYRETLRQLRAEVEQWYDRFAKENKISLAEARRILDNRELKEFKMALADFIKEAKRLDLDPAHIRMLENASMRVRLTRSQEIYLKTAQYVEKLAKSQGWQLSGLMREVYTDSVYKTAYETQKVTGFENFRAVRERQIEEAISKPWAPDGADFSSRIWKNKTQLINSLQTDITQSLMTGTSTAQLSEKIAARFNTSYNQAYRLVETETAYIQERAMLDTYDELGLEQYQICAVLDSKTSEICQNLDGKVFDRKDAKPGITMPPFHCHCRSTTVPYIEGLLDDGGRVARDPETGKTVEIPDMTYKEWYNKYVKNTNTGALIGLKTSNGITIAKLSKHQQERADIRNLDLDGIRDALINPLHVGDVVVKDNGNSQRFIGEATTVNINPDTGVIITSWPTGKSRLKKYKKGK
ncbi:MAG: minor capsid protein [Negativicoccus massiliensis]|nr:minor capsid protein [Negativicoccus massiliensis]